MGSPRANGNTASLLEPFLREAERMGAACEVLRLYEKRIEPCSACRSCQKDWTGFGCPIADDVGAIFDKLLKSDCILLATPIYSWYCTAPMKALLDRLVYGMNKYYGDEKGPSLWAGKSLAILTTCGYRPERGADLFEEGVKRYAKHSALHYLGMLCERHMGYGSVFMDAQKEANAAAFVARLVSGINDIQENS